MEERRRVDGPPATCAVLHAEMREGQPSEGREATAAAALVDVHRTPDPWAKGKRKSERMHEDAETTHLRNVRTREGGEHTHPSPPTAMPAALEDDLGACAMPGAHPSPPRGGQVADSPRAAEEPRGAVAVIARRRITGKSRVTIANGAGGAKPQGSAKDPALDALLRRQLKTVKSNVDRSCCMVQLPGNESIGEADSTQASAGDTFAAVCAATSVAETRHSAGEQL